MLTKKPENPLLIFWLLLYLIPYLFVIRSSNNIYLARFHGLQCSFMTFRCHPCTTCSIYYDWNFRKGCQPSVSRIQCGTGSFLPSCVSRYLVSCVSRVKRTVPLKFLIFSSFYPKRFNKCYIVPPVFDNSDKVN